MDRRLFIKTGVSGMAMGTGNSFQIHMDSATEDVCEILKKPVKMGSKYLGMKIFGEGKHVKDEE